MRLRRTPRRQQPYLQFGQIQRVYAPGINCGFTGGGGGGHHMAVGMYAAHNLIHDCPHAGVLYGSWDSDHREMHVYGNIVFLRSVAGGRGTGYLYKIGTQAQNPTTNDCHDNIAIACNVGFQFVSALPSGIESDVAISCRKPWLYQKVQEGKAVTVDSFALGRNMTYEADPGFVDMARRHFRLKPGAALLKDLSGFPSFPGDKVGLYVDEYRHHLPTDAETDRYNTQPHGLALLRRASAALRSDYVCAPPDTAIHRPKVDYLQRRQRLTRTSPARPSISTCANDNG